MADRLRSELDLPEGIGEPPRRVHGDHQGLDPTPCRRDRKPRRQQWSCHPTATGDEERPGHVVSSRSERRTATSPGVLTPNR